MSSSPLIKFQTQTAKVKAISFHHERPWVVLAVYDGSVQIWNYITETLVDKYTDHCCPVRAVHFHPTQPLIASAGDNSVIHVYNYHLRKVVFSLVGHSDYIRSVEFHHELPWLLSSSDDQSVRIWDWQKRSCLAVLLGHHYYVMCARWHPSQPLIASASLDATVRVWDYSPLLQRHSAVIPPVRSPSSSLTDNILSDVVPVHILEHNKAVNTVCWSLGQDLLFTGGGETTIRVWKCTPTSCFLRETLYGHSKPITSLSINANYELVSTAEDASTKLWIGGSKAESFSLSTSSITRGNDKFWATAVSRDSRLFAVGHEVGFYVFKVRRERPGFAFFEDKVIWTKPKVILSDTVFPPVSSEQFYAEAAAQSGDLAAAGVRLGISVTTAPPYVRQFYQNPFTKTAYSMLFCKGGSYILITLSKPHLKVQETFTNPAKNAVFVSASRFAALSKDGEITFLSLQNEVKRTLTTQVVASTLRTYYQSKHGTALSAGDDSASTAATPFTPSGNTSATSAAAAKASTVSAIFPGPTNTLLLRTGEGMALMDCTTMKIMGDVTLPSRLGIKRVAWNADYTLVAIVSKTIIYIVAHAAGGALRLVTSLTEDLRVKSLLWDPNLPTCLLYNTESHLKYLLSNGDGGVLRTLNEVIYLGTLVDPRTPTRGAYHAKQQQGGGGSLGSRRNADAAGRKKPTAVPSASPYDMQLQYFTRSGTYNITYINCVEYLFKHALMALDTQKVAQILCSTQLRGRHMVQYVRQRGLHEVALQIVDDIPTKFDLCLKSGNITECLECAVVLNSPVHWKRLAAYAQRAGAVHAAERGFVNTKDLANLALLYLMVGEQTKLEKVALMATSTVDDSTALLGGSFGFYDLGIWLLLALGQDDKALGLLLNASTQLPANHLALIAIFKAAFEHHQLVTPDFTAAHANGRAYAQDENVVQQVAYNHQQAEGNLQGIYQHLTTLSEQHQHLVAERQHVEGTIQRLTYGGDDDHDGNNGNDNDDNQQQPPSKEQLPMYNALLTKIDSQLNYAIGGGAAPLTTSGSSSMTTTSMATTGSHTQHSNPAGYNPPQAVLERSPYSLASHLLSIDTLLSPSFDTDILFHADRIDIRQLSQLHTTTMKGQSDIQLAPTANLPPVTPLYAGLMPDPELGTINPLSAWPSLPPHLVQQQQQQQQQYGDGAFGMASADSIYGISTGDAQGDDLNWFQDEILGKTQSLALANKQQQPHHSATHGTVGGGQHQHPSAQHDVLDEWDMHGLDINEQQTSGGTPTTTGADQQQDDEFAAFNEALLEDATPHGDADADDMFAGLEDGDTTTALPSSHAGITPTTAGTASHTSRFSTLLHALDGPSPAERWAAQPTKQLSTLIAGDFHTAMFKLNDQVTCTAALPDAVKSHAVTATLLSTIPVPSIYHALPPTTVPVEILASSGAGNASDAQSEEQLVVPNYGKPSAIPFYHAYPHTPVQVATITGRVNDALESYQRGEASTALAKLKHVLTLIPFAARDMGTDTVFTALATLTEATTTTTTTTTAPDGEVGLALEQAIRRCREYTIVLLLDAARNTATDPQQKAILAGYATHAELEPHHQILTLWLACKYSYALRNFNTIAYYCRRITDMFPQVTSPTHTAALQGKVSLPMVQKMLAQCTQHDYKDNTPLDYHPQKLTQLIGQVGQLMQQQQQQQQSAATPTIAAVLCIDTLTVCKDIQDVRNNLVQCSYCGTGATTASAMKPCVVCSLGVYAGGNRKGFVWNDQ